MKCSRLAWWDVDLTIALCTFDWRQSKLDQVQYHITKILGDISSIPYGPRLDQVRPSWASVGPQLGCCLGGAPGAPHFFLANFDNRNIMLRQNQWLFFYFS